MAYVRKELERCTEYVAFLKILSVDTLCLSALMTTTPCMTTLRLSTATNRRNVLYMITGRVHARQLYLADQFRMFDESDFIPPKEVVYNEVRESRKRTALETVSELAQEPSQEPSQELVNADATLCKYKNVLKNGIVVAACESRYDHFVSLFFTGSSE